MAGEGEFKIVHKDNKTIMMIDERTVAEMTDKENSIYLKLFKDCHDTINHIDNKRKLYKLK